MSKNPEETKKQKKSDSECQERPILPDTDCTEGIPKTTVGKEYYAAPEYPSAQLIPAVLPVPGVDQQI